MGIKGHNFTALIYLMELEYQCGAVKYSFEKLVDRLPGWKNKATETEIERRISPLEAQTYISSLISGLGMISKTLTSKRSVAKKRSQSLMELLGEPNLPNIFSRDTRNSNEHLDERLDNYMKGFTSGSLKPDVWLSEKDPNSSAIICRRLNPSTFELTIAGDSLDLKKCLDEIDKLRDHIKKGVKRLETEKHEIFGS